jgi:hypothetical protein
MSNSIIYEIEDGVDFFKALKQFIPTPSDKSAVAASEPTSVPASASASAISLSAEEPRCLITDEKLRKDHIKLKCGHRFNYVALFKEVLFQKCSLLPKNLSAKIITTYTKPNIISSAATATASSAATTTLPTNQATNVTSILYNSSYNLETTKLNYNEMKCPYCRTITPYILPYYPYPDVCKVKYVNVPANMALPSVSCEYGGAGGATQTSNADAGDNDKNSCRASCMYNEKYDMILCSKHLNKLETNGNKVSRQKRSQTTVKSNTNETPSSNVCDENVIISHHNPATTGCSFILLSGPRKGCPCKKQLWSPKTVSAADMLTETSGTLNTGLPAFCKVHYDKGVWHYT